MLSLYIRSQRRERAPPTVLFAFIPDVVVGKLLLLLAGAESYRRRAAPRRVVRGDVTEFRTSIRLPTTSARSSAAQMDRRFYKFAVIYTRRARPVFFASDDDPAPARE